MRSKFVRTAGLGIFIASLASAPLLAAMTVTDAVRVRIEGYQNLGVAFKNANDELKKSDPFVYALQISAREIGNAAKGQLGWFAEGTGRQPGVKTAAKPEIWSRAAEFKAAQSAFSAQASLFMKAAASGNVESMRVESRKLGGTCGACHRVFRYEEKQ